MDVERILQKATSKVDSKLCGTVEWVNVKALADTFPSISRNFSE